jgi:uncharacterized heparinase superfamily protein
MSILARLGTFKRNLAFVRHIPLTKLLRRVQLNASRHITDQFPALERRSSAQLPVRARLLSVVAPQTAKASVKSRTGWRFEFLHRTVEMPGPQIDWWAPGPSAADQLWRMNLHYMEYLENCEDEVWLVIVDDWISSNGRMTRGAWRDSWNSYTLSLRVVVWLQELARRSGRLPQDAVRRIEAMAVEQIRFLTRNLETDLGGNHLIKNIKALLWASAYFGGDEALNWRTLGLRLLGQELPQQILADGMHYERSPSYHCQVHADLLDCRLVLGADPLDGALDDALARMAQVTADLRHPDGLPAQFNDAGLAMTLHPQLCLDAHAKLFGSQPTARSVFAFPQAGYFGTRSSNSYFVIDCGRIAPDDLPAHGHGDILSFEWSVGGGRFIVDQGVIEYVAGPKRQASRSAVNHNTLCLEGADQAEFFGAFRCGRRPKVDVRRYNAEEKEFLLEGSHDGFSHLPGRPRHIRRFQADAESIRILDRLEGTTDRNVTIGFLLHPDVSAIPTRGGMLLERGPIRVDMTANLAVDSVPAVWWPDMGRERPTRRLLVTAPGANLDATFVFRIVPAPTE